MNAADRSPRKLTPALLFCCSIFFPAVLLTAQDDSFTASAGKFECRRDAGFIEPNDKYNGVSLAPLDSAPKDLPANIKPRTFGPFPDGMSVEFYQFLTGGGEGSMATETDLNFYVHVLTRKDKRWYALQAQDPQTMKADPGPVDPDAHEEDAKPSNPVAIYAPDPAKPLFQASYSGTWTGANTLGVTNHLFLLDLRSSPPKITEHFVCQAGEGGGVCTAPDSGSGTSTSTSCEWHAADYICNDQEHQNTGWGERLNERSYYLFSGKDAYIPPPEAVNEIRFIADHIDRRRPDGQQFVVPDIGATDEIYSVRQPKHDLYLFVARGQWRNPGLNDAQGSSLDARFFVAENPSADRPPIAVELKPETASSLTPITFVDADRPRAEAAYPAPPTISTRTGGAPMTYKMKKLHGNDDFFVLQVTVKEGNYHVIYWIGVDQRSSPIIADLYRLSTDAAPYYQCNRNVQEASAASYQLVPGPSFRATIDVEPLHIVDGDGKLENQAAIPEPLPKATACTKHISWDRTKGFVFAENSVCKAIPPRSIVISDDGQITTKPMQSAPSE